jgi:hypothetical protein
LLDGTGGGTVMAMWTLPLHLSCASSGSIFIRSWRRDWGGHKARFGEQGRGTGNA